MGFRRKTKPRCSGCGLWPELCACELFPRLDSRTPLFVVRHARERYKPSNTAKLLPDAWHYGDRPVLVATHHELPPAPQGGTAWAVQGPIAELVAQAETAARGKDVYLDGGGLVRQGLDAGLVDELCLTFLPLILGRGIRLWEGLQNRTNLKFDPPTMHGGGMVQVTARISKPVVP